MVAERANWPAVVHIANCLKQVVSLGLSGTDVEQDPGDLASHIDDHEKAIGELETLVTAARRAGLDEVVDSAQNRVLDTLADLTRIALRKRDWGAAVRCRRMYLMRWSKNTPAHFAIRSKEDERPLSYFRRMGEVVGLIHSRNYVNGTRMVK